MKTAKKLLCALLVLVMTLSLLPIQAAAAETRKIKVVSVYDKKTLKTETIEIGDEDVLLEPDNYLHVGSSTYQLKGFSNGKRTLTVPAYDGTAAWRTKWSTITITYEAHNHKYTYTFDRMSHKQHCACGRDFNVQPHIDPATDEDKICTCGYAFSDNTELTTLWFANVRLEPRFTREVREYSGSTVSYYNIEKTNITAFPLDAKAVITLPENTTLAEGPNVFEISVLAEDKTTTGIYTVTVIRPVKVDGIDVSFDGKRVSAATKVKTLYQITTVDLTDAVWEKLLEVAAQDGYEQAVIAPNCSKWGTKQVEVTLTGEALNQLAEAGKAALALETPFGTAVIPHDQLTQLCKAEETLTISVHKDSTLHLLVGDTELTEVPASITLTLPEA